MAERDDVVARILAAQQRLQRLLSADPTNPLMRSTLTMQQLKALLIISQTGGASGQELAQAMGVGLATVTGLVDRLVAAGQVERREDAHDRRVRRVLLTGAGRETVDGIVTAGRVSLLGLLEKLSVTDLEVVERAMNLLGEAARSGEPDEGADPAARGAARAAPQPRRAPADTGPHPGS